MTEKITSPQDLLARRAEARRQLDVRSGPKDIQITVHMGTCGIAAGARDVLAVFAEELERAEANAVSLCKAGCVGLCDREPMITLRDRSGQEYRYGQLNRDKVHEIVTSHIVDNKPLMDLLIETG